MELKIEARNVELRKGWQTKIQEEQEKLIRHYANFVLHLRVSIEATSHYKEGGFEIKLVASVPNDTVVVTRNSETVRAALTESFDVLTLQLKEIQRKKRKSKKVPASPEAAEGVGVIRKLSPHESYGFITSADQRDIYFHENALKNINMDDLTEGDSVAFGETYGDKGPQASWVRSNN
ncbi:HPF/RaiA family ribosome-associated protein [Desulforhopalus singaporensis]|uniref:Cold shock protein, CspA family n=1 Tax=Desulforhopalus singaporensis TaxID=91360 RepID=A0A1H0R7M4_9BACT|nr:HPF/RaiA family ribosome-associated protein [Desulforhopalus singaporensis]SDP25425.1 Cold shock protein, CspA family [Desulforhopalus singaporensis]